MAKDNDGLIGEYTISDIPPSRIPTIDVLEMGISKHHVKALLEIDVTAALTAMKEYESRTGNKLSFTAWMVKCISATIEKHKPINSYINVKRRKMVTFEDIDITVIVEKEADGQKVPLPYVVRKTNEKTAEQIGREIHMFRDADFYQEKNQPSKKMNGLSALYAFLPQSIRMMYWKQVGKNPFFAKKTMGTAVVTSVGMMGKINGYLIPNTIFTLCFGLGSIVKKPGVIENQVAIRDVLFVTILFDHDIVDGGPAARFVGDLVALIENAHGIA